ncbi:MAG: hypothetical protein KatS3mg104_0927 [Phycisphaerae bacterium]|nr:MAG: hypothetical protein KatS3mg104_0927 [Phycisphaerae bacterium]
MIPIDRVSYTCRGLLRRVTRPARCPGCNSDHFDRIDRKITYNLLSCRNCGLLFRYPYETPEEMACFYQKAYKQSGLTTDLPTDEELARMCQTLFRGTEKDFSFLIRVLEELGVRPGARILDFGANWGYTSYQLRQAGYDPFAYEISTPRAVFGKKLGISIATELTEQDRGFDAVFSSHVLEHVPNPLASLKDQLDRVKPGGYVIGLTPNGSRARRENDPQGFHTAWGRVHPVLLSDAFLDRSFDRYPAFISGRRPQPDELRTWAGQNRVHLAVDQPELFFVLRNT